MPQDPTVAIVPLWFVLAWALTVIVFMPALLFIQSDSSINGTTFFILVGIWAFVSLVIAASANPAAPSPASSWRKPSPAPNARKTPPPSTSSSAIEPPSPTTSSPAKNLKSTGKHWLNCNVGDAVTVLYDPHHAEKHTVLEFSGFKIADSQISSGSAPLTAPTAAG